MSKSKFSEWVEAPAAMFAAELGALRPGDQVRLVNTVRFGLDGLDGNVGTVVHTKGMTPYRPPRDGDHDWSRAVVATLTNAPKQPDDDSHWYIVTANQVAAWRRKL